MLTSPLRTITLGIAEPHPLASAVIEHAKTLCKVPVRALLMLDMRYRRCVSPRVRYLMILRIGRQRMCYGM